MATPGELNLTVYDGAAHSLTLSFEDSNGNDYDISSYSAFTLNLYPLNSSTAEDAISLSRSGSDLTYSFPKADIQGYTKNMRLEVLFDDTIVLRGNFTVTGVQGTETISTSATVTLSGTAAVISVSDVVLTNVETAFTNATDQAFVDADYLVGQDSSGNLIKDTWADFKSAIATYYNSLTATLTNKRYELKEQDLGDVSGAFEIDLDNGQIVFMNPTAEITPTFSSSSNASSGHVIEFALYIEQIQTLNWPAGTIFGNGAAPDPSSAPYTVVGRLDENGTATIDGAIPGYATL